jgi:hypothetical protein
LKPEEIYIDMSVPIPVWAEENRDTIMNALYKNIFDFVENKEDRRCVLRVISQLKTHKESQKLKRNGVKVEFVVAKNDIEETIDKLIEHLEDIEEYEKCAELVKLKKKL